VIGPETNPNGGNLLPAATVEVAGSWGSFAAITAGPVAHLGTLDSVSCWAAEQCVAVGVAWHSAPAVEYLIAYELDGSSWTALSPPPLPSPDPPVGHASVSCIGSGTCRVMGLVSTSPRGATVRAYVATFAAGSWSTSSFPVPPNTLDLGSITCSSTASCTALLDTGTKGRFSSTVLRSYVDWMSASGWRRTMPKGWGDLNVTELRCPSPTTCVAVGALRSGTSIVSRQALGWGTSVVPGGGSATSASCTSSTCEVVVYPPSCGDLCGHGPSQSGGVMTLQGNSWTGTMMAPPPGMLNTLPSTLTCDPEQCTVAATSQVWVPSGGDGFYQLPFVARIGLTG
jgi:hypothetical protein